MARLVLCLEGRELAEYNMTKERYTIGRLPDNDIRLDHPAVSGHHALVINILDDSFLEDLNSTNGTSVNGRRISKHPLQHGDTVRIGKHELRFIDEGQEEMAADEFERTMIINTMSDSPAQVEALVQRAVGDGSPTPPRFSAPVAPPPTPTTRPSSEASHAAREFADLDDDPTERAKLRAGRRKGDKPAPQESEELLPPEALAPETAPNAPPAVSQQTPPPVPASPPAAASAPPSATSEDAASDRERSLEAGPGGLPRGKIQVLSGSFAGKELELKKALTTLGRPGVQVAAISRRAEGFFIVHVDSGRPNDYPKLNGTPIGPQAHRLQDRDVIELAGVKMGFFRV